MQNNPINRLLLLYLLSSIGPNMTRILFALPSLSLSLSLSLPLSFSYYIQYLSPIILAYITPKSACYFLGLVLSGILPPGQPRGQGAG